MTARQVGEATVDGDGPGPCTHISAVVLASLSDAGYPLTGPVGWNPLGEESVGVGVGVGLDVGLDVGLELGDGVGLDGGDDDGDGCWAEELGDAHGDGDEVAPTCDETPRFDGLPLADEVCDPAEDLLPEPLGPPPPWPPWLEVPGAIVPLPLLRLTMPSRICPRANTPATTRTTAPATARAGRSQFITGPGDLRWPPGPPLDEAQARMPPRPASEPARRAAPLVARAAVPASAAVLSAAAVWERIVLKNDSDRTTTSQRSVMNSLHSSHHCRLSHGSASRPRIFVKPSPTGSTRSVVV